MDLDTARTLLTTELEGLDERARFAERSRAEASGDTEEGALGQHPGDYGSETAEAMDSEMLVDTVADQRRLVQEALDRVEDGSYGTCVVCGTAIDDERLEARPEAATCREHADTAVVS